MARLLKIANYLLAVAAITGIILAAKDLRPSWSQLALTIFGWALNLLLFCSSAASFLIAIAHPLKKAKVLWKISVQTLFILIGLFFLGIALTPVTVLEVAETQNVEITWAMVLQYKLHFVFTGLAIAFGYLVWWRVEKYLEDIKQFLISFYATFIVGVGGFLAALIWDFYSVGTGEAWVYTPIAFWLIFRFNRLRIIKLN